MKLRRARGSFVAALAGAVLACACLATPAYASEATVGNGDEFIAAVNNTNVDIITLSNDVTVSDDTTGLALPLNISRSLTINGRGNTLTNATASEGGAGQRNGMNIVGEGTTVAINNLTIVDNNGSTLTAQNGGDAILDNVTLDHSNSTYGCALIISDGSEVTMNGCTIKLGTSSWGGVNIDGTGRVTLGNPTVTGDAGKALVYVDSSSPQAISDYVVDAGSYLAGPLSDGKPAVSSKIWTVSNQTEFENALENAPAGMTIKLANDITVTDRGLLASGKTGLTIDGNGHAINASALTAYSGNNTYRSALSIVNCTDATVQNLAINNGASDVANNGLNIWGGTAAVRNVSFNHGTSGAPMVVAAGANVTVGGTIQATIGASSWGVANVDTKGGNTKLTFDDTVQATFDTAANPNASVVYIDEDNNTPLKDVVSGLDNAGLYLDSDGTAIEAPVVTFMLDGQTLTTIKVSSDGTLDMKSANDLAEAERPAHKVLDAWYTDEACTTEFDPSKPVTEDLTLYGRWATDTDQIIEITFMNGNKVHTMVQIFVGDTLAGAEVPDPTWAGHTFVGWYAKVNEDGTVVEDSKVDLEKDTFETSTTLYAGFVANDEGGATTTPDSGEKTDGKKTETLAQTSDPTTFLPAIVAGVAGLTTVTGAAVLRKRQR
ncbi:pectate lyase-like adhesive domain-containing protein [Thermophilibacter sp.]